jgi:hypothetical protein
MANVHTTQAQGALRPAHNRLDEAAMYLPSAHSVGNQRPPLSIEQGRSLLTSTPASSLEINHPVHPVDAALRVGGAPFSPQAHLFWTRNDVITSDAARHATPLQQMDLDGLTHSGSRNYPAQLELYGQHLHQVQHRQSISSVPPAGHYGSTQSLQPAQDRQQAGDLHYTPSAVAVSQQPMLVDRLSQAADCYTSLQQVRHGQHTYPIERNLDDASDYYAPLQRAPHAHDLYPLEHDHVEVPMGAGNSLLRLPLSRSAQTRQSSGSSSYDPWGVKTMAEGGLLRHYLYLQTLMHL